MLLSASPVASLACLKLQQEPTQMLHRCSKSLNKSIGLGGGGLLCLVQLAAQAVGWKALEEKFDKHGMHTFANWALAPHRPVFGWSTCAQHRTGAARILLLSVAALCWGQLHSDWISSCTCPAARLPRS